MKKKVLLLCAGHNDLGTIKALKKLGMYVIVTGYTPGLIGEKYADEYIKADYSQKESILSLAKELNIDAICPCCNDFGVYTASYVAEKLGLPGHDKYETALLLHNKEKFKAFAQKHQLPIPEFHSFQEKDSALLWAESCSYPLIIKPSDFFGGQGTTKVESKEEMSAAIEFAFEKSRNKIILAEEFIQGTQHGFCTFLQNQKVVAHCNNDEYSFYNPYRVEIDTFPASHQEKHEQTLIEVVEKIAATLQLQDGIFHLQYIERDGKPYIIEVMRRILGNLYFTPANLFCNISLDYWETRARCGLSCENFPKNQEREGFFAYKSVVAEENGIIDTIQIPSRYDKYVIDSLMIMKEGEEITDHSVEIIGFLFFVFSTQEEMLSFLVKEYQNDVVTIKKQEFLSQ